MKKTQFSQFITIAVLIWMVSTIYLLWLNPSMSFLDALTGNLTAQELIFRLVIIVLVLGICLSFHSRDKKLLHLYQKLKKAVDTSGEIIFITDREGIFTYINPEFTQVYGYEADDIIGQKTPRILKSGAMDEENYRKFWQHILEKKIVEGEIINKTSSNRLIDVQSSANPILDSNDNIIGFLCVQRDITERKRREKELIESEKTARAMLNASEDPVFLIDTQGKLLSLNEAAVRDLGDSLDGLINKSIYDFNISYLSEQGKNINTAISSKLKVQFDGTYREKSYNITVYPLFDLDDQVSRLVIFTLDMTEQKQAQQTIKDQNRFLHSVIEALDHPFFVIDVNNYKVKLANSAARGVRDIGQVTCYALTHNLSTPCDSKKHICPLQIIKQTKEPVITEHVHYDKNGQRRDVEVHAYPIFDKNGELFQMIEYTLDITDRKKAIQEIEQLNKKLQNK
ncbi:PAS domain-containing protein [candidate division KSB1 bacterium]|nr:PAS domain-containing protein [candidate division KSB1 bacterium]